MKALRLAGPLFLMIALALGVSACQKAETSDMSSTGTDETMAMNEPATDPAPVVESEPAPPVETPAAKPAKKPATRKPASTKSGTSAVPASETRTVSLPAGTTLSVELMTRVHTGENNVGDRIEGKLLQPLTTPDGMTIAPQGAMIRGEIAELKRASKSRAEEDRASVKLAFTSVETVDGEKTLAATVTNVEALQAGSTTKRDALIIGGSAAAGAVLGKVIGHDTKDAAIGAVAGAVIGTGAVMAAKGHQLELKPGSKISLRADQPITIVAR